MQLPSQESINMVKMVSSRLQECLGPFTMLLIKGSCETGLFRHLFNHVFQSPQIWKYVGYEGHHFFKKYLKFNVYFKISERNG